MFEMLPQIDPCPTEADVADNITFGIFAEVVSCSFLSINTQHKQLY